MNAPDRFHICLPYTLAQECPYPKQWSNPHNFSNDAHDPGGKTMCGIIQREYDTYRKRKGLPVRDVRLLTQDEGEEIYEASYWLPECPKLPPGLDLCFFDEAVNAGPHAAIVLLQRVIGVGDDGMWGPLTDLAVRGTHDVRDAVKSYTAHREQYYRGLRGFPYFGKGWLRRSEEIRTAALTMVTQ